MKCLVLAATVEILRSSNIFQGEDANEQISLCSHIRPINMTQKTTQENITHIMLQNESRLILLKKYFKKPLHFTQLTTVCVDKLRLHKANFKVVQNSWFMEITECSEIIFTNKYVRISQRWQSSWINRVTQFLSTKIT